MMSQGFDEQLDNRVTRRTVVKTGVKVAYAAPLIAASFKLSAHGALALTCLPDFTKVTDPATGKETCCICDCVIAGVTLDPATVTCHRSDGRDVTTICLSCEGGIQSL